MSGYIFMGRFSSQSIVPITKATLLSLIGSSNVSNSVYNITDIDGFESIYIQGFAPNTISANGLGLFLVPDYTIAGNNLGQMEWNNIPTLQPDEFVIWGGYYHVNNTASPVTPTITDHETLSGLLKVSKSLANGYVTTELELRLDSQLNILQAIDQYNNSINFPNTVSQLNSFNIHNNMWSYSEKFNTNMCYVVNCGGAGYILSNRNDCDAGYIENAIVESETAISQVNFTAGIFLQPAYIKNVKLNNGSIGSFIYGNELHLSYFENIELTNFSIDENHLTNLSFIKNVSADGNGSFGYIASCVFNRECGLDGVTYTTNKQINNTYLNNQTVLENIADINVINFSADESIDFTGFTADVINQSIECGKGWFTITHDFSANPVTSGNTALYNLIPTGARVVNLKTVGNATGTGELAFGMSVDAANLLPSAPLATVNAGQTYNAVSTAATANRSLIIAASGGDVTGGTVTVLVEFIV